MGQASPCPPQNGQAKTPRKHLNELARLLATTIAIALTSIAASPTGAVVVNDKKMPAEVVADMQRRIATAQKVLDDFIKPAKEKKH